MMSQPTIGNAFWTSRIGSCQGPSRIEYPAVTIVPSAYPSILPLLRSRAKAYTILVVISCLARHHERYTVKYYASNVRYCAFLCVSPHLTALESPEFSSHY